MTMAMMTAAGKAAVAAGAGVGPTVISLCIDIATSRPRARSEHLSFDYIGRPGRVNAKIAGPGAGRGSC